MIEDVERKDEIMSLYDEIIISSSKIFKDIYTLGHEHRNMKRPFIYSKANYP
jgi:hypothetical protein